MLRFFGRLVMVMSGLCLTCVAQTQAPQAKAEVLKKIQGLGFACEIRKGNELYCWGRNSHGQIGNERMDDLTEAQATKVNLGKDVVPVDGGAGHETVCALTTTGRVKCWGGNMYEQLGRPSGMTGGFANSMGDNLPYVDLGKDIVATAIAVGQDHCCVAIKTGGVKCFGHNNFGQLGVDSERESIGGVDGEMGDKLPRVPFFEGKQVSVLASEFSSDATCAYVPADKQWYCWGNEADFEKIARPDLTAKK